MELYDETYQPTTTLQASPERLLIFGAGLGFALTVAGVVWVGLLRGQALDRAWFTDSAHSIPVDVLLGAGIGAGVSVVLWILGNYSPALEAIREKLATVLDLAQYRWWHSMLLASLAAIPEEIFFRGAMQPVLGLAATALIFGALHSLSTTYFAYATVAGLILGLMANWSGALWMPIAAHFATDFVSLMILARWARRSEATQEGTRSPV